MHTARRYTITAAALLTALLALPAGTQNNPAIPDLDPADCSNGTFTGTDAPDAFFEMEEQDCRALVNIRNHWTRNPDNNLPANHPFLTWGTGDTTLAQTWAGITLTYSEGTNYVYLDLSRSQLIGPIPAEISQLTHLRHLDLSGNELTGTIPPELGGLIYLGGLDLSGNQLTGTIPHQLSQIIYHWKAEGETGVNTLSHLDLSGNQLTGTIPHQLSQLTDLWHLDLSNNQLTGPIPAEIGQLTRLDRLYLGGNKLTGPIPAELGQLTNLTQLYLHGNQLTGPIPAELGQLTNLTHLALSFNELTGPIPAELGQLTNLTGLYLSGNQLTGTIPPQLGNLTELTSLSLRDNKLTGPIPAELGQLTNLETLWMFGNQLTGPIPAELGQLTKLESLYLGGNQLTGPIPAELAHRLDQECTPLFTGRFCDDDKSVHESSIETIARWGITQGCDRRQPFLYCPKDSITRRQMAAFLHRAVTHRTGTEPPSPAAPAALTDVEGSSSLPYIQWAVAAGVMQAPEGLFNPEGKVTRADMAQMIAAAFDHITPPSAAQGIFTDMTGQPDAAIRAAEALRTAGITAGCSTSPPRYCPNQHITRSQMAALFARAAHPPDPPSRP